MEYGRHKTSRIGRRRILGLVLVAGLTGSTPTSSQAVLTELVVGGAVVFQVAGILGEAIPQLAALTQSVQSVIQSGEEIGGTVGRIFKILNPNSGKEKSPKKAKGKATQKSSQKGKLLILPKLKQRLKTLEGKAEGDLPTFEGGAELVIEVRTHYLRREGLQRTLAQASGPEKKALEMGLQRMTSSYEKAFEALKEHLVKLFRSQDGDGLEAVLAAMSDLSALEKPAFTALAEALVGRGRSFSDLYEGRDSSHDPKAFFAPLVELLASDSEAETASPAPAEVEGEAEGSAPPESTSTYDSVSTEAGSDFDSGILEGLDDL